MAKPTPENDSGFVADDPQDYGAPTRTPQDYGAPTPQDYGAPDPQDYGAPDPQDYGAPDPNQLMIMGTFMVLNKEAQKDYEATVTKLKNIMMDSNQKKAMQELIDERIELKRRYTTMISELEKQLQAIREKDGQKDREIQHLTKRLEIELENLKQSRTHEEQLEKDRASLEKDKASLEKDQASLEKDKASLEKNYASLEGDYEEMEAEFKGLKLYVNYMADNLKLATEGSEKVQPEAVSSTAEDTSSAEEEEEAAGAGML
jgi:chromosome segregation ATPase